MRDPSPTCEHGKLYVLAECVRTISEGRRASSYVGNHPSGPGSEHPPPDTSGLRAANAIAVWHGESSVQNVEPSERERIGDGLQIGHEDSSVYSGASKAERPKPR